MFWRLFICIAPKVVARLSAVNSHSTQDPLQNSTTVMAMLPSQWRVTAWLCRTPTLCAI